MAIQLHNDAYAHYQLFSGKKALDAKDPNNIDGAKATRIAYIVFKIEDVKDANGRKAETIVVDKTGYCAKHGTSDADVRAEMADHAGVYDRFTKDIQASGLPRFGVIYVYKVFPDGHLEMRECVLRYTSDTAGVKSKMVYSQAEGNFKGKLGSSKVVQACGTSELDLAAVVDKIWTK